MSKARPAARRKAAKPRRKAKASTRARKAAASLPQRKVVRLKPLYEQLSRTIKQLQMLPPSDRVRLAIDRLAHCQADIESTCGPTMDVPAEEALPA